MTPIIDIHVFFWMKIKTLKKKNKKKTNAWTLIYISLAYVFRF